jgi:site-specific DNA-methyltransferase (adenine-specific)
MIEIDTQTYTMIPVNKIVSNYPIRSISRSGLIRIRESIHKSGFLTNYPITVFPLGDGTYDIIDGNHRWVAASEEEITSIPCVVRGDLSESERFKLAFQSNNAAETMVPSTLVTFAEFVWRRSKENANLDKIADELGWSLSKVKQYSALYAISKPAWTVIVTTFENSNPLIDEERVTKEVTTVTFTERLLRDVLNIAPEQQLELIQGLADGTIATKGKFKSQAEAYTLRNEMHTYAISKLGLLGEEYAEKLTEAVYSGSYDTDWKTSDHPKLHKLLESLRDEWEKKNSIHLIHGDFHEEAGKIISESIDLIITDPPYNVASNRVFSFENRNDRSLDFGEWDKFTNEEFIEEISLWVKEWNRILRPQGSGYIFCRYRNVSHYCDLLEREGLQPRTMISWHKKNPGPQFEHVTFRHSCEHILFFTKGESGHTFNWQGENEMHDFIETPICAGKERLLDAKGTILHPTQKPLSLIKHLVEISSNRGDMLFDGFGGTFTTAKAAKDLGRKFIGIEREEKYFHAGRRRMED